MVSVNMRPGGISTKNLMHNIIITKEIVKAFRENIVHKCDNASAKIYYQTSDANLSKTIKNTIVC